MAERTGVITFKGNPMTLVGNPVETGKPAPDATVTANDLKPIRIADLKGKVVILSTVPSIDTPVCDTETRRFNEEAGKIGGDLVVLTVSMDLPFAFRRWCGAAGITAVTTASDYKDRSLGQAYGLQIKELGLLTRAVYVIDKAGVVQYQQIVSEVTQEPDYDAALAAARKCLA